MQGFFNTFAGGAGWSAVIASDALTGLLLAFVLGQVAAWLYVYTHEGLSYSRAFVQSIILLTVVLSMGMMVIGNNIAIAFGLIGALAVIRFRNILKDTRDTAFIFFTLIVGLATGTSRYQLAILGAIVFCAVALYLHWTQFGSRNTGDSFMRFRFDSDAVHMTDVLDLFQRHCHSTHLVSQRIQESGTGEMSYRLAMRNPAVADELVRDLRAITGVSGVTLVAQEDQSEA